MSVSRWFTLALSALLYFGLRWRRNKSKLPLPPGPNKLPLIGNLLNLPREHQWEAYQNWSKELNSDIIHLDAAGTSIVILSSVEAIQDLFEKRSSLYSGRDSPAFMNPGDEWRSHRKLFHEALNRSAAKQFHPQQIAAVHEVLRRCLHNPHDIMGHFRHMTGALIMDIAYGIKVLPSNDPYIQMAEKAAKSISIAGIPGAFLVDIFPALKYVPIWFPGAGFKRKAKEWRKDVCEVLERPFQETKRNIATGTAQPSFTSLNLHNIDESEVSDRSTQESLIKAVAATLYIGGADTSVTALGTFVLAMLANPEAQTKAQGEIDSVIGPGNLPDFTDEPSLPYVSAIVKEVLRWRNAFPIAFPHYITVDDEYRGYRIPAGSLVIGNTWAILHDQNVYPDPDSFKPERFLLDGKVNPTVRDPDTAVFGFGRRVCPGRYMATEFIWITVASMLAAFDIKKAVGFVSSPTDRPTSFDITEDHYRRDLENVRTRSDEVHKEEEVPMIKHLKPLTRANFSSIAARAILAPTTPKNVREVIVPWFQVVAAFPELSPTLRREPRHLPRRSGQARSSSIRTYHFLMTVY
ncbi:Cytochrome P450 [Mycena venus]|uniref:Cytochrome P450 n=1 Tax=Mycena venus TaxID=2733690 RepID=A0A8H6Y6T4_9AGAR|nr:Cytochrome P450 [Mycena venus]